MFVYLKHEQHDGDAEINPFFGWVRIAQFLIFICCLVYCYLSVGLFFLSSHGVVSFRLVYLNIPVASIAFFKRYNGEYAYSEVTFKTKFVMMIPDKVYRNCMAKFPHIMNLLTTKFLL